MTGFNSKRRTAADKQKLWDKPSVAFDEWWNGDNDESTNPFRLESGAYWAWAGWKAALEQPAQEPEREALKLALEALEESQTDNDTMEFWDRKSKAITAIKEALAQPAQREWVGLTDEDCKGMSAGDKMVAMWANRILKERNS